MNDGTMYHLCNRAANSRRQRHGSGDALEKQASKMVVRSNRILRPVCVGDNVYVPIPSVDRGHGDHRNLLCCIIAEVGKNFKLGNVYGTLETMYCRSQFTPTSFQRMTEANGIKDVNITVRGAARAQSIGDGQGFIRCACKTGCKTKSCKCRKTAVLCNSRCHNSLSCSNK